MYRGVAALLLGSAGISCAPVEAPDGVFERGAKVEVWHHDDEGGIVVIEVASSAVKAHLAHGDWSNPIYVDPAAAPGGNGLAATPYRRLTDALAQAAAMRDATGEREWASDVITIHAAPGAYTGSFSAATLAAHPAYEILPVLLDVPGVALIGSTVPTLDGSGLPTGAYEEGTGSRLVSDVPLTAAETQNLVLVTDSVHDGVTPWAGNGVTLSGWVFESGNTGAARGGAAIAGLRVVDFRFERSIVQPRFRTAYDIRYMGSAVDTVYSMTTSSCSLCLAGGDHEIRSSRIQDGLVGVFIGPGIGSHAYTAGPRTGITIAPITLPEPGTATALIEDSDLTGHNRNLISSGLRVVTLGPDIAEQTDVTTVDVVVRRTRFGASTNGIAVDAGFITFDHADVHSAISLSLEDDVWTPTTKAPLLVTFTRGQPATGQAPAGNTPYLSGAEWTIDLAGTDQVLETTAWIDHPLTDPWQDDDPPLLLGNTLTFDGVVIDPGTCRGGFPANVCTPAIP